MPYNVIDASSVKLFEQLVLNVSSSIDKPGIFLIRSAKICFTSQIMFLLIVSSCICFLLIQMKSNLSISSRIHDHCIKIYVIPFFEVTISLKLSLFLRIMQIVHVDWLNVCVRSAMLILCSCFWMILLLSSMLIFFLLPLSSCCFFLWGRQVSILKLYTHTQNK